MVDSLVEAWRKTSKINDSYGWGYGEIHESKERLEFLGIPRRRDSNIPYQRS